MDVEDGRGLEQQAASERGSHVLLLASELLRRVWPPERVVAGLRVSKGIRKELILHSRGAILVVRAQYSSNEEEIAKDIRRISHLITSVKARALGQSQGILKHLLESLRLCQCNALSHLDLRGNNIGAEGAGRLAGALGECKALSHLDLSSNEIGDEGAGRLAGVRVQGALNV